MSVSRTALVATAAWLAVVAVGSVLVWSVISRAGNGEPGAGTAIPAATATTRDTTPSPPTPAPSPSTSGPEGGPDDAAERRTWQGAGGYVSVECRGRAVSLVAAQADAGFAVEIEDRGPEQVKVLFEGQGDEGRETEIAAGCVDGVPDFSVNTGDS